jgi:hypothetical protein
VFKTLYCLVVTEEKRKEKTFSLLTVTPRIGLDLIDPQYISRMFSRKSPRKSDAPAATPEPAPVETSKYSTGQWSEVITVSNDAFGQVEIFGCDLRAEKEKGNTIADVTEILDEISRANYTLISVTPIGYNSQKTYWTFQLRKPVKILAEMADDK